MNEKEKVIERWVERLDQLLNTGTLTRAQSIIEAPVAEYEEEDLIVKPNLEEVRDIIDKLKNNKCAEPDNISPELIKYGGIELRRVIYEIIFLIS